MGGDVVCLNALAYGDLLIINVSLSDTFVDRLSINKSKLVWQHFNMKIQSERHTTTCGYG